MGTDIYVSYEVREGGRWVERTFQPPADWDRMTAEELDAYLSHPIQLGRSYALFAILADVRNGVGFAGVRTGTGYRPISPPRGLPEDPSPEVRRASLEDGEPWGYGHSWLTLRELLEYDWGQRTVRFGQVDAVEYARFRREGSPGSWSGAVLDPDVVHISNAGMDALLEREPHLVESSRGEPRIDNWAAEDGRVYITAVQWEETYAEAVAPFVERTLSFLRGQVNDPDNLRMVFWFSD